MNMYSKKIMVIVVTIGWLCMSSCQGSSDGGGRETMTYKMLSVEPSDEVLFSHYSAKLRGQQFVEIRPQVAGVITDIRIEEGETVHAGQVLFVIDQVPYKANVQTAKANVESAEAKLATSMLNMESREKLYAEKVISEFELQTAKNQLAEAKALVAQMRAVEVNAQNELSYTEVKSPVDGVASMIPYRVGALVDSRIAKPLVTVSDDKRVYAYFSMNENQILDILQANGSLKEALEKMEKVQLILSNGTDYGYEGRIDAVSGTVDEGTGSVRLRACFDNPNQLLRNGASAEIVLPTHRKGCIVIPQTATYELQDKVFVYKVVDGKTVATPIDVFQLDNGTNYIVESGLQRGDVILAEGAGLARNGMMVKGEYSKE